LSSGLDELAEPKAWLVSSLKRQGILKTKPVEEAILTVPREKFIWNKDEKALAYIDEPLSLGQSGQTISAPHMVVIMLEELDLKHGMTVLEIGGGSGYNAALISCIVSGRLKEPKKLVTAVERDPTLVRFAKENIAQAGLSEIVEVVEGDGTLGYPPRSDKELYDRIIVTAGAPHVPQFLKLQLKENGLLLIPVGNRWTQTLLKLEKTGHGNSTRFREKNVVECMFVPLIGTDGFRSS
jgi:protein-L-isoaspartate(D-aspartate) O-methyltransferase